MIIDGKKYRKLKSLWNGNAIKEKRETDNLGHTIITPYIDKVDVCDYDKWVMINGIEYEQIS